MLSMQCLSLQTCLQLLDSITELLLVLQDDPSFIMSFSLCDSQK